MLFRGSAADEKRKQDARIAQLEEEIEEERTQNELLLEKFKRANMQVCWLKKCDYLWSVCNINSTLAFLILQMEQFQTDLYSERAALQKMESSKNTLEKQARKFYDENSV